MKLKDLTGMKFGNLLVKHRAPDHLTPNGQRITSWACVCDCGKEIVATFQNLRSGHTKSCGCMFSQHNLKHGECVGNNISRLYNIWAGIKARCLNENNPRYKYYGKRGISICDEWLSFDEFKKWAISSGYKDNLTIDRINNNGNYEPGNCRWTTQKVQSNNSRKNVVITFDNKSHTVSEWSDIVGIPYKTLWYRLNSGWGIEKSLTEPLKQVIRK